MEILLTNIQVVRHMALNKVFLNKDMALVLKSQNDKATDQNIVNKILLISVLKYAFGE